MTDWRKLEPVPWTVERPERVSQTLARHANYCPRSAALYLKHGGGTGHELDRGSVVHKFAERMTLELLQRGEPSLWAPHPGEDTVLAAREVASLTKVMVDEILDDPELGFILPSHEADAARIAAYHLAIGWDVDMKTVLGVERKFVMDVAGWEISGKIDLVTWPEPAEIEVTDYKTALYVPDQEEFERSFQQKLYGALVLFGQPVEKRPCSCVMAGRNHCTLCGGTGEIEVRLDPIGEHVHRIKGRQVHPRVQPKWGEDGKVRLVDRTARWSRKDLADFLHDVERAVRRIEHGLATRDWPARHGPHCSECPAEPECPLPRELRRFAKAIGTREQASEAMEWAERMGARVTATKKEVRAFAEQLGERGEPTALVVGTEVHDFTTSFRKSVKRRGRETDWEGLEAATQSPDFRLEDWVLERPTTAFKKRPAAPGEIERLQGDGDNHQEGAQEDGDRPDDDGAGPHGPESGAEDDDVRGVAQGGFA